MADHKETLKLPLMMRPILFIGTAFLQICMHSDIIRRLFNFLNPKTPAVATTVIGGTAVLSSDISIDPSRDLWLRLFVPSPTDKQLPLIVFFHGGGFSFFSPHSKVMDDFCRTLAAKLPAVIASLNYRLRRSTSTPASTTTASTP